MIVIPTALSTNSMRPAVFLDRDGTINEDVGYISDPDQLQLIPGAAEAVQRLRGAGYFLVLITNQAGVGRGLMTEDSLREVLDAFGEMLDDEGACVDAVYYCLHHPEEGVGEYLKDCDCRKPKPGMLLRAAEEHQIDLSRSFMVGDHMGDVLAGKNAGCQTALVLTGHGKDELARVDGEGRSKIDKVAADLTEAAQWMLSQNRKEGISDC